MRVPTTTLTSPARMRRHSSARSPSPSASGAGRPARPGRSPGDRAVGTARAISGTSTSAPLPCSSAGADRLGIDGGLAARRSLPRGRSSVGIGLSSSADRPPPRPAARSASRPGRTAPPRGPAGEGRRARSRSRSDQAPPGQAGQGRRPVRARPGRPRAMPPGCRPAGPGGRAGADRAVAQRPGSRRSRRPRGLPAGVISASAHARPGGRAVEVQSRSTSPVRRGPAAADQAGPALRGGQVATARGPEAS